MMPANVRQEQIDIASNIGIWSLNTRYDLYNCAVSNTDL